MVWRSGQRHSADLRARVLDVCDSRQPAASVAGLFRVSSSHIYTALRRRLARGEATPRSQINQQKLKLADHHGVLEVEVKRWPDAPLEEFRG